MSTICDELRAAIIQYAMQGKLTKQLSEDGNAEDLLKKIDIEKEKLVRDGKIKDHEKLSPIKESEIPFVIPSNWKWIRFNDYFEVSGGSQPPKSKFITEPKDGYVRLYQTRDYGKNPQPVYIPEKTASKTTKEGDILLARYGGSLGKVFYAKDGAYNVAMAKVIYLFDEKEIIKQFLFIFLHSDIYRSVIFNNNRSAQAGFNKQDLNCLLFPLPPLAEQKRIVEKVDELMARVADLEQSADALASLKKAFPDDIKASLLQYAMQGKLTKQLPEDGNAEDLLEQIKAEKEKLIAEGKIKKQKPLAPITDDEIPFSIPEDWKWMRLESVISFIGDKSNQIKESDVKKEGTFPVVSQSKEKTIGYCDDENKVIFVNDPVLVFGDHTALIKYVDFDFVVGADGVKIMKPIVINPFYLYYVLTYNLIGVSGMGGYSRHYKFIKDKLIPVPPHSEQKRIVDQLNSLMQNINAVGELIASE